MSGEYNFCLRLETEFVFLNNVQKPLIPDFAPGPLHYLRGRHILPCNLNPLYLFWASNIYFERHEDLKTSR